MNTITSSKLGEVKTPQIHVKTGQLRTSAEITHELLAQLENRLDSVLHALLPSETGLDCKSEELVPLAASLASIDSMQQAANDRLTSILNRLEL